VAQEVLGTTTLEYDGQTLDLSPPWPRRSFWDLLEEHTGLERGDEAALHEKASEAGVEEPETEHADWLALQVFEKFVEDLLVGPLFVKDYPRKVCPLTRTHREDPELAERFELYLAGMEVANAYTELNDPQEQERRFLEQVGDAELQERVDEDFLRALAYGMPPAGGLGIGIDRLVMVLTGQTSIREVILFPLLRPQEECE
jgi:lysyl-tRNA synthetase class 2